MGEQKERRVREKGKRNKNYSQAKMQFETRFNLLIFFYINIYNAGGGGVAKGKRGEE